MAAPTPIKTVLFIAGTQQGKSATIDEIYNLICGKKPSEHPELAEEAGRVPVVGDGCVSCTHQVTPLVSVPVPKIYIASWPRRGSSVEPKVKEMVEENAKIINLFHNGKSEQFTDKVSDNLYEIREMQANDKDFDMEQAVQVKDSEGWKFRGIDTPGMNDSEGRDDQFIEDIIDMLVSGKSDTSVPQEVSAFVFIVKNNTAFDQGWQTAVRRYWDQFPQFRGNWIFIHTMMDPFADYTGTTNSYEEHCLHREAMLRNALLACLEPKSDAKLFVPQAEHFFVENKPGRGTKATFRRWEKAASFQKFLCAVKAKPELKANEIKFRKMGQHKSTDELVKITVSAAQGGAQKALSSFEHGVQKDAMEGLANAKAAVIKHSNALAGANSELADWNTSDVIITNQTTASADWCWGGHSKWWDLKAPDCEWWSDYEKNDAYYYGSCSNDGYGSGTGGTAYFKLESPGCRGYYYTVRVKAYRYKYHKDKVEKNQMIKAESEKELKKAQEEVAHFEKEVESAGSEIKKLQQYIDTMQNLAPVVAQEEFALETWTGLKPFYKLFIDQDPKCLSNGRDFDRTNADVVVRELYVANRALQTKSTHKEVWSTVKDTWSGNVDS